MKYFLFSILILFIGCEPPFEQYKKQVDYKINSIRVDDDAQYHIVAISPSGRVKTVHDADADNIYPEILLRYEDIQTPILRVTYTVHRENAMTQDEPMEAILPTGYSINTFDD